MRRIASTAFVVSTLVAATFTTGARADPYDRYDDGYGYQEGYRDGYGYRRDDDGNRWRREYRRWWW